VGWVAAGIGAAAAIMIVCDNRTGRGGRGGNRSATRRETRQTFREMTEAMLMGVAQANCWTLAEALGHGGPHRLQHFLARAVWDHDAVRDRAACWVARQLADDQAVLIVDETGEEKLATFVRSDRECSSVSTAIWRVGTMIVVAGSDRPHAVQR
jgi:DDE superfamily endonuclease